MFIMCSLGCLPKSKQFQSTGSSKRFGPFFEAPYLKNKQTCNCDVQLITYLEGADS